MLVDDGGGLFVDETPPSLYYRNISLAALIFKFGKKSQFQEE